MHERHSLHMRVKSNCTRGRAYERLIFVRVTCVSDVYQMCVIRV